MAQNTILIKKYENRRLYDATNSRYVNLDDVAKMLQRGNDVRVVDAASGEDITRLVLTQIIVEGAKTPDSAFPLDILRQMVIASGRASQESALRYMTAMMEIYQNTYRAMAPPFSPFEFMNATAAAASRASEESKKPEPADSAGDTEDVEQLKQRVAELEKLVSSLGSAKPKAGKPARKTASKEK